MAFEPKESIHRIFTALDHALKYTVVTKAQTVTNSGRRINHGNTCAFDFFRYLLRCPNTALRAIHVLPVLPLLCALSLARLATVLKEVYCPLSRSNRAGKTVAQSDNAFYTTLIGRKR